MPRILILGGGGMLGHKLLQTLRPCFPETYCTIHGSSHDPAYGPVPIDPSEYVIDRLDAMDLDAVERVLRERQPDVTINCIGVIKQRSAAKSAIPSITINSLLPHRAAEVCAAWGGRLIHFSTDCVFSGRRGNYTEDDLSDAEDLYGKTKFLGEVSGENALTLRTSIIGRELKHYQSLLDWLLRQNHSTIRGFTRAFYSGVTTNHLAEVVAWLIREHPMLSGLYQVASQTISKYDLLCLLRDGYGLDIEIAPDAEFFCDRSMQSNKFREATGYVCPPWPELVQQLVSDPTPYGTQVAR